MKNIISFILILVTISTSKSFAQSDPAYDSIANLNLDYYAGLPVDSFLHKIPQSYTSMDLYGVLKNDKVGGLWIEYASGMNILIKPIHYHFMNPVAPNNGWNFELFKKETAYYIIVGHPDYPTRSGKAGTSPVEVN
jgi:hypothetical protein